MLTDVEKGFVVKKRNLGWSCKKIASVLTSATKEEVETYLKEIGWKKLPRLKVNDRIGLSVRKYNQIGKVSLPPLPAGWT